MEPKAPNKQENPAIAREDALQPIRFQYWPSRSSKVNDFYLICKGLCHVLSQAER